MKNLVGRGPTKSKAYIHDDCVVLLLREGHTRSEETMFEAGAGRGVAQGRVDISETIGELALERSRRRRSRRGARPPEGAKDRRPSFLGQKLNSGPRLSPPSGSP